MCSSDLVVGHFDFSQLATTEEGRVELVDIGGGHGACLKQILDKHPQLEAKKCILQDVPDVIKIAKSSGTLPPDLILMEHDFRSEQPVKSAYLTPFLRGITESTDTDAQQERKDTSCA